MPKPTASSEEIRTFPISTWVGLGAIFLLVFAFSAFSYTQLNRILEKVSEASQPDLRLLAVKGIQSDIQDAENSVKTFSLTRDTNDLRRFSEIAEGIEADLELMLINQSRQDDGDYFLLRLDSLVYEKFEVQRAMLELSDTGIPDQTLTRLKTSLNRAARAQNHRHIILPPMPSIEPEKSPVDTVGISTSGSSKPEKEVEREKKKGIFGRILGRKNKRKVDVEVDPTPISPGQESGGVGVADADSAQNSTSDLDPIVIEPKTVPAIKQLARELEAIRQQERARARALTEEELSLTREEQQVSAEISAVVTAIEVLERKKIALRTTEAESLTREANRLIVIFCVTLTILVLLLSFGIFSYFRTSNRHQKGIEEARNSAMQLAKARESFLATMSHEIRTPMNAIIGFTERVLQSKLKKEQSKQLEYVRSSANHLLEIVNDVLDFSKLEAGAMTFLAAPFSLKESLETCLNSVRLMAENKGVALRIELDDKLPEILNGDAKRLRQVLLNLLTNAARFTEKGEICLQAKLKSKRRNKIAIEFAVVDSGIGIAEADQKAVFEEFTQANLDAGINSGGTGLGLPICKRIVEMQGGKLWMESTPGKGTRVSFWLEFGMDKSMAEAKVPTVVRNVKKVLVVDDTEYNRLLLQEVLVSGGLEIALATNGVEAIEAMEKDRFDLVLLDIRMPEMDGIEVLKRIRSGKSGAPVGQPVIALTAAASAEDQAACRAAGCNAILGKPFKEAELWKMMGVVPAQKTEPENEIKEAGSAYSLAHLQAMAHGNQDFVIDMVQSYLEMAGRSRKEMKRLLEEENYPEIGEILHKLAPATRHLDAQEAYAMIKNMEAMIAEGAGKDGLQSQHSRLENELNRVMEGLQIELEQLENDDSEPTNA